MRAGDLPTSVLKLKILFQISQTKKCHFGAKGSVINHLTFSFSHGHGTRVTWILFFVQQAAGHGVQGIDFRSYLSLTVSQTQKGRGIDLPFSLSVAYHVTVTCLYTQWNDFKYCYLTLMILFEHNKMVSRKKETLDMISKENQCLVWSG